MTETDLSTWLTIAEAATALRCSERTVERLSADKKLEQRFRPQRGSPDVAVFSPQSVAEEAHRRHRAPAPFVLGAMPGNGNGHGQSLKETPGSFPESLARARPDDDPVRQFYALMLRAIQSPPSPPVAVSVAETPWVDIPTAAAILGRSQAYVRRQIKAGRLPVERDRCLVVRRADLEQL